MLVKMEAACQALLAFPRDLEDLADSVGVRFETFWHFREPSFGPHTNPAALIALTDMKGYRPASSRRMVIP